MSSAKVSSPAARLLRNSRLFAMPNPIPPPRSSLFNQSAIAPHPVAQAITTTDASAYRGDWGLKRNLPSKTKVKHITYSELDTMEHYTPFTSAENEVLLVKKWQEMDIPLAKQSNNQFLPSSVAASASSIPQFISAFELEMLEDQAKANGKDLSVVERKNANWDFKGPYLGKMTPGRLKSWMEVRSNARTMRDFLYFAVERLGEYKLEERDSYSMENSPSFRPRQRQPTVAEVVEMLTKRGYLLKDIESAQEYIQATKYAEAKKAYLQALEGEDITNHPIFQFLRANTTILELLVNAYFDIPTLSTGRTHPSAGLFYARSVSYMEYKPGVGGDNSVKSIPGRVLYTRRGGSTFGVAGVGGVVASTDINPKTANSRTRNIEDVEKIEHFTPNMQTYIDADGAIRLKVALLQTGGPGSDADIPIGTRRGPRLQQAFDKSRQQYNERYAQGQDLLDTVMNPTFSDSASRSSTFPPVNANAFQNRRF